MHAPKTQRQMSAPEQYWAARAITAETLLSANASYSEELRTMTQVEQDKRAREIASLQKHHEDRHSKLERLAFLLLTWLIALVAVIVYLLIKERTVPSSSRWTTPLHFTVPVLSPFTSVVEHETSVVNARVVALMAAFGTLAVYGCFRYWLNHHGKGTR
ncbi:hypothetical protein K474DRAFT_1594822 [Panus rudis PR-1116 ss-1]|nr:hypothetical protein K474DRAFT_1594822 [Panus rudis PR-1116 ss-1]